MKRWKTWKTYGMVLVVCVVFMFCNIALVKAATLSITFNGKEYQYAGKQISVTCGGTKVNLSKSPGILEEGYALLPYNVFQHTSLGVKTTYNKTKGTITFQYGKQTVVVTLNSKKMKVNGVTKDLPIVPRSVRYNSTKVTKLLVPSRSVAESLGLGYSYSSAKATVSIWQKTTNSSTSGKNESTTSSGSSSQGTTTTGRKVEYNGKVVTITKKDVTVKTQGVTIKSAMPGVIINNTAMLPAYNTFHNNKHIKTSYVYSASKKQITIKGNGNTLLLTLGSSTASLNGKKITLAEPAWLMKNLANNKSYCMVPGKSVAEALGYQYTWDNTGVISLITIKEDTTDDNQESDQPSNDTTTQKPSTDENNQTSSNNTIPEGAFDSYELLIKRPSTKVTWKQLTVTDDYNNEQFIITLPADYTSYYKKNPISYNNKVIEEVTVQTNREGKTEIIIKTPVVQAMAYKETNSSWQIFIKNPSEIYDKIVVLDAGHGGSDSGAVSTSYGVIEKDVALDIVQRTQTYFNKDNSIKVYYTRLTDAQSGITYGQNVSSTTVSVVNRANFANEVEADLFISVHCNSATNTSARGTEILYSSKNTSQSKSGLTSNKFADLALPYLLEAVGSTNRFVKDSPNLIVCKNTDMPAILLEVAFLSNKSDAELLKSKTVLEKVAKAIYNMTNEAFVKYPTNR